MRINIKYNRTVIANESFQHDAEIAKLIKDVETYKDLFQKTETRLSKKIKELSSESKSLLEERNNLKKKVKGFEDYDEIKRELQIMKVRNLLAYIYLVLIISFLVR